MHVTRRSLIASTPAVAVAGLTLTACNVPPTTTTPPTLDPSVIDTLQKALATACGFVPAAASLLAIAEISFPALLGAGTIAQNVLEQFSKLMCDAYKAQGKIGTATLKVGDKTVDLHGLHVVDGKFVAF